MTGLEAWQHVKYTINSSSIGLMYALKKFSIQISILNRYVMSSNSLFFNYIKILRFDHRIKQIFAFPGILLAIYKYSELQITFLFFLKIVIGIFLVS